MRRSTSGQKNSDEVRNYHRGNGVENVQEKMLNDYAVLALAGAAEEFEGRLRAIKGLLGDLQLSIEALEAKQSHADVLDICHSLTMAGKAIYSEVAHQKLELAQLELKWGFLAAEVQGNA